jgi:Na+/H+ antiporter NhaD/arsenite permease-like protein
VPLTLAFARRAGAGQGAGLPVGRLVIFQALAVNAGSAISPVGNPQNLFLWQNAGVGFGAFVLAMAPLVLGLLAGLALLAWGGFSSRPIGEAVAPRHTPPGPYDRALARLCLLTYPAFLVAVNSGWAVAAACVVTGVVAVRHRRVLPGVDWALLAVFVLMFVNLGLLVQWPVVAALVPQAAALPGGMMTLSALVSQGMSNVPAAIFLAPFAPDWVALAWGVSIGGFGLAIGSLANLIALRLAAAPGLWREFHLWSLTMFGFALALGLVLRP